MLKRFDEPLSKRILNIEEKTRSNLFAWRGQFSPQLVQSLLSAYCPYGSTVVDPFAGSGTVLFEAARASLSAYAYEVNPAAWIFSKVFEFANQCSDMRICTINRLQRCVESAFPVRLFAHDETLSYDEFQSILSKLYISLNDNEKKLLNALVIILDLANNDISNSLVQSRFQSLTNLVMRLPYSDAKIKADLCDARALPLDTSAADFVITSPPYINVFNYHQNYRRSAEVLGWDILSVARSEIGSNRANRSNRFFTVVQYCLDIVLVLKELWRILSPSGRVVCVVGYESKVLGVPFNNAELVSKIAVESGLYSLSLQQNRVFTNRFGKRIREDILNLSKIPDRTRSIDITRVARLIALKALQRGHKFVSEKNRVLLSSTIDQINSIQETPIFNHQAYSHYRTQDIAMMVKERRGDAR